MSSPTLMLPPIGIRGLPLAAAVVRSSDGAIVEANGRFDALFGLVPKDRESFSFDDLSANPSFLVTLRKAMSRDPGPREMEADCLRADGAALRLVVSAARLEQTDGDTLLVATFLDITERWRRERAEAEMARFPEMNPAPVLRFDRVGTVVLANSAARAIFGATNLLGRKWCDLCPGMDESLWQRVLAEPEPPPIEAEIGPYCILFTHVRTEDGIVAAFGADMTKVRRAERELRAKATELAEIARFPDMNPGPVLRMDLDGIVLLANAAARTVFGDALVGRSWGDICPGMDEAFWRGVLATTAVVPIEARIGEDDFVFQHRHDPHTRLVFSYGTNVTRQKQAERGLRQSEKMATLGTLAAGVAHELNNPAAATRRAAEQLRDAFARLEEAHLRREEVEFTPEGREVLATLDRLVREAAGRATDLGALVRADREVEMEEWLAACGIADPWELAPQLVSAGLDAASLEPIAAALQGVALSAALGWAGAALPVYTLAYEIGQGSARISEIVGALKSYSYLGQAPVQSVNLHEGIDNTLVILRNKLKQGITVIRDFATDLPAIQAYGSELNQVWTNLLDNAADAMNAEGTITIRTRRAEPWAVVEIEDDGPGIPANIQSRIFDPFFTTKAPGKGTGLGLSTSYSIVKDKHKGEISVESRPGLTRFTIRLPLEQPPEP